MCDFCNALIVTETVTKLSNIQKYIVILPKMLWYIVE